MPVNTRPALDARPYAGKGLQTLSPAEMKRLDKGLLQRMGNHDAFCLTRGIDPKAPFVWTWVGDVPTTVDEDGFKLPILDAYMLGEAYSPVRLRHDATGVECIVGTWTAEHCFGVLDMAEARKRVLHEDAVAVHGKLRSGDAGYEGSPDNAFEGVDGYNTETVAGYTGNAEDAPKAGAAYAKAWRARVKSKGAKDETANRRAIRENIIKTAKTPDDARRLVAAQVARWEAEDNRK